MKIEISRKISGFKNLEEFVKEREPVFAEYRSDKNNVNLILVEYDCDKLLKNLTNAVEDAFKEKNFKITRSAFNALWSSEPDQFSFALYAKPSDAYYEYTRNAKPIEKIGEDVVKKKTLFGGRTNKTIEKYRVVPSVSLSGTVSYEGFKRVEPKPVLEALAKLDYASRVIPTSEDLLEAIEKIRLASKNRSSGYSHSSSGSHSEDDDLLSHAAAFALGAVLF